MKSEVRIIGGKWRGRKLPVVEARGLRPTPDRIRETLFNWLQPVCRDAIVLDCFAGSGVLGFEAMSRGAGEVVALEQQREVVDSLRAHVERLGANDFVVMPGDARDSVLQLRQKFDIVFIDPPYAEPRLRIEIFQLLEQRQCLREGSRIYFEWPASESFDLPSAGLRWLKHKSAGRVNYAIAEWQPTR
jgi:16S rRNA (guanine966-N2)-methyltransferase